MHKLLSLLQAFRSGLHEAVIFGQDDMLDASGTFQMPRHGFSWAGQTYGVGIIVELSRPKRILRL